MSASPKRAVFFFKEAVLRGERAGVGVGVGAAGEGV